MRAWELMDNFGVPTPTLEDIAKKHGVSLEKIRHELDMGVKVEREHVLDDTLAAEIARDHLAELPDYYTRLTKMEKGVK